MEKKHPRFERTFVIVKPDGVQRGLTGEVINRIERVGMKLVGMKFMVATREQAMTHYGKDDAWCEKVGQRTVDRMKTEGVTPEKTAIEYGRAVLNGLLDFLTCSPIVAMVWEGNQAVGVVKKLVGGTEPLTSDVGTIRGDLTLDSYDLANVDGRAVRNIVHCSDQTSEAEREIAIWFNENEIVQWKSIQEKMLYDVNLDGHLE
jgi:nucleoside-diphosphate kinase